MSTRRVALLEDPETGSKWEIPYTNTKITVEDILRILHDEFAFDADGLIFDGKILDKHARLSTVGYIPETTLYVHKNRTTQNGYLNESLLVRDPQKPELICIRYRDYSVSQLRKYLCKNIDPFDELRYNRLVLEDGHKLSDYKYRPGTEIQVHRHQNILVQFPGRPDPIEIPYRNYTIQSLIQQLEAIPGTPRVSCLVYHQKPMKSQWQLQAIGYKCGEIFKAQCVASDAIAITIEDPLTGSTFPLSLLNTDTVQTVFDNAKKKYDDLIDLLFCGQTIDKTKKLGDLGNDPRFILYRRQGPRLPEPVDDRENEYLEQLRKRIPVDQQKDFEKIRFPEGFDEAMKILLWDACGQDLQTLRKRLRELV